MDLTALAKKLGLSESKHLVRKAAELRRLSNIQFNSSVIGIGETCKAIICLQIAATAAQVIFDWRIALKLSGMSEKAYDRSLNAMQNGLGVKYRDRFLAALPASRRASDEFTRPVFTAVAFYLWAKRQKLKVDKVKFLELCGTSESEFSSVSASMKDLCHDNFGISNVKKDPKNVKGNRDLVDELPKKRRIEDGGYLSTDEEISLYKKRKRNEKYTYEERESTSTESNNHSQAKVSAKRTKPAQVSFFPS